MQLNRLLADMVEEQCTHCFMEVSSHSIVQKRIAGIEFTGGVLPTSLTTTWIIIKHSAHTSKQKKNSSMCFLLRHLPWRMQMIKILKSCCRTRVPPAKLLRFTRQPTSKEKLSKIIYRECCFSSMAKKCGASSSAGSTDTMFLQLMQWPCCLERIAKKS